jgi:hypothetical protein
VVGQAFSLRGASAPLRLAPVETGEQDECSPAPGLVVSLGTKPRGKWLIPAALDEGRSKRKR